jgi:hypothetical protein
LLGKGDTVLPCLFYTVLSHLFHFSFPDSLERILLSLSFRFCLLAEFLFTGSASMKHCY